MRKFVLASVGALAALGLLATSAFAGHTAGHTHNAPGKAQEYKMPLVRNFPECTAAGVNDTKPPPVGLLGAVCSTAPPAVHAATSGYKYGPTGKGLLSLKWVKVNLLDNNPPAGADSPVNADVLIKLDYWDFRTPANVKYTGPGVGSGIAKLRITDIYTGTTNSGTQRDIIFPIPAPPGQGCLNGRCKVVTSADGAYPGAVQNGMKANVQVGVGQPGLYPTFDPWVQVNAPDGFVFATPGLYLP